MAAPQPDLSHDDKAARAPEGHPVSTRRKLKTMVDGIQSGLIKPDFGTLVTLLMLLIEQMASNQQALTKRIVEIERRLEPPARTNRPTLSVVEPGPYTP